MTDRDIVNLDERRASRTRGKRSGGNGNGNLTTYRLERLEQRVYDVEKELKEIGKLLAKIDTKIDSLAERSYVLKWFGVALAISIMTLIAHIVLRSAGS